MYIYIDGTWWNISFFEVWTLKIHEELTPESPTHCLGCAAWPSRKNSRVDDSSHSTCFGNFLPQTQTCLTFLTALFGGTGGLSLFPIKKIVSTKSGYRANAHLLHDFDTIADHGTSILVHAALHVPNQQISEANLTKATKTQKKTPHQVQPGKIHLVSPSSLIALKLIALFFGTSRCSRWRGDLVWSQWNQHGSPPATKGESLNKSTICYLVLVNSSQS